jgi:putative ABC transport system substrate-binding protein
MDGGRELTVTVYQRLCADAATGMPYPVGVAVDIERRQFVGCGVTLGYATDLAHPLYNATGMMAELNSKRLELLHEILPGIKRIAALANPLHSGMQLERTHSEAEGRKQGIEVLFFPTSNRNALTRAFAAISSSAPQAILVFSDAFMVQNRDDITDFAMRQRIPVISGWAVMADGGALFTYGPRLVESYRRVAYFADRILKGAKSGRFTD